MREKSPSIKPFGNGWLYKRIEWLTDKQMEKRMKKIKKLPQANKTTIIYAESSEVKRLISTLSQKPFLNLKKLS
ncbi:MAG TPA: hypothetical protein VMX17_16155 [Candidatus Glassbacteria bacterium]|nr:hypothetical protein [Candidatus Glassbacteria bacterium]